MNIKQFRKSLQNKWLSYYADNRQWMACLRIWVNCDGHRRPSSSFILATLAVLEPQLNQILPLIVDLSSNPDRIVAALGLNFNPDEHPKLIAILKQKQVSEEVTQADTGKNGSVKMLPAASDQDLQLTPAPMDTSSELSPSKMDEACEGGRYRKQLSQ